MLNQHRDKIETVQGSDIVTLRLGGVIRTLVASGPAAYLTLDYHGGKHTVVAVTGVDASTTELVRFLAVPDQHVTIIR